MIAVDLDGTLVTRNTFRIFAGFLRRRILQRRRIVDLGRYGFWGAVRRFNIVSHRRLKWELMKIADSTLTPEDYDSLADEIMRYLNPRVMGYVTGKPWVLATAASAEYVMPLARRLDCRHVIATERPVSRRFKEYTESRGAEKLRRVQAVSDGADIEVALSDHPDDLPLLMAAHTPVLVNPTAATLADPGIKALGATVWRD